jgi:hypothetical protein
VVVLRVVLRQQLLVTASKQQQLVQLQLVALRRLSMDWVLVVLHQSG